VRPLAEQTLYEILDVPPAAGSAEIAAALDRTLALIEPGSLAMYSLMSPDDAKTLSRRVEEARATLLDPAARSRYDATLAPPESSPPPAHAHELPPVIPALRPEQVMLDAAGEEDDEEVEEAALTPVPGAVDPAAAPTAVADPGAAADAPGEPEAPSQASGGHIWPPATPAPALPDEAVPLQLTAAVAPPARPIPLEREVAPAPRSAHTPPPRSAHTPPPMAAVAPGPLRTPAAVPDFASWTGDALRSVREARGLSLQQVSERTKVTRHHIENIEADRYTVLPAPVYLRGILLSLARELRLDGQKISRSYLERMASALAPPPLPPPRR
jgi:hypothetical protein